MRPRECGAVASCDGPRASGQAWGEMGRWYKDSRGNVNTDSSSRGGEEVHRKEGKQPGCWAEGPSHGPMSG